MTPQAGRLKLLFVIDNLSTGGAQRQMVTLAIGLQGRGHHVELFCYATGDLLGEPLRQAGITVHRHIKRSRFSVDVLGALAQVLYRGHYQAVLAFMSTPACYALVSATALTLPRVPVIASERFCDLPGGVSGIERMVRQLYRVAAHVTTNSAHQRENLQRLYPWLTPRLSTIYNGLDLNRFTPPSQEPDNPTLRILTIASVSRYKNGLCLVEALACLRDRHGVDADVSWIGERSTSGDRKTYLDEMQARIEALGLGPRWHWLDQRKDIVEQLHAHDVVVHPSYGEGMPNVVCEALACGRPILLSDTLDHGRIVQDGQSGYLFDCHDPTDLAAKLARVAGMTRQARAEMGRQGRAFAQAELSTERLTNQYEQLFYRVARGR